MATVIWSRSRTMGSAAVLGMMMMMSINMMLVEGSKCVEGEVEVNMNETFIVCCTTCPTGSGVDVQCSSTDDSSCKECIPGKTYSDMISYNQTCQTCSTCGNNTHFILHPCNQTHNTVCGCPNGYYYDAGADRCKLCDLCPAGWGASRKCNTYHNTICTQCSTNVTFSNKLDFYSECEPCSPCRKDFFALQDCSTTEDTICMNKFIVQNPATGRPAYNVSTPEVYRGDGDDNNNIIPVYCSVLGLVVIGLLGYVVFKHYRRMRTKTRHKTPCNHEDVEYAKAAGGDSGVFVEHDYPQCYSYCMTSRVRDLPVTKRKELEKILCYSTSDGWKFLAKQLGYNDKRLAQFESKQNTDNNSGFKHMLHDWERHDLATVAYLLQSLRNIGREDAARVLFADSTEGRTQLLAKQHSISQSNMV